MNRYLWIALASILLVSSGCGSACPVRTAPLYPADDGTLYRTVINATATVLKDSQIAGAGAFISEEGLFLTAAYVVHTPHDRIELLLHDGQVVQAEVVTTTYGHWDQGEQPYIRTVRFTFDQLDALAGE